MLGVFPEPPDEKPLLMVESKVKEMLNEVEHQSIQENAANTSVANLLEKYIK
mgnify:CR=1 FL=1